MKLIIKIITLPIFVSFKLLDWFAELYEDAWYERENNMKKIKDFPERIAHKHKALDLTKSHLVKENLVFKKIMTPNQTNKESLIESILNEFDEKFLSFFLDDMEKDEKILAYSVDSNEAKSFISQSLPKVYEQFQHNNEILINTILETKNKEIKEACQKALEDVIAKIDKAKERFRCAACDGAKCEHTQGCQALAQVKENILKIKTGWRPNSLKRYEKSL